VQKVSAESPILVSRPQDPRRWGRFMMKQASHMHGSKFVSESFSPTWSHASVSMSWIRAYPVQLFAKASAPFTIASLAARAEDKRSFMIPAVRVRCNGNFRSMIQRGPAATNSFRKPYADFEDQIAAFWMTIESSYHLRAIILLKIRTHHHGYPTRSLCMI
jgi:hypothetical protein